MTRVPARSFAAIAIVLATVAVDVRARAQTDDERSALARAFPRATSFEKKWFVFTAAERGAIACGASLDEAPRTLKCFVARGSATIEGFAVIADTPGKCQPITYLLATNASAEVRAVEILAYREGQGGEVREERWREQFVGKDARSPLRLGQDVRNVAGATISCRSVTDAVRRDVQCLAVAAPRIARDSTNAGEGARAPTPAATRARLLMGTTLTIEVDGSPSAASDAAMDAAFDVVAGLETALSDWNPASEVERFADAPGGTWRELSEPLRAVLARALDVQRATGGAFDPCMGALTRLARRGERVDDAAHRAAVATCGLGAIELDGARARIVRPGARIDVGAIGKGFALDRAAAELERRGVHCALLDFGGQVLALDAPAGRAGWTIAVRDPSAPDRTLETLLVARASLSTTADYERGVVVDGKRCSHVLDPRTGAPVEGMLGAIVLHRSATDADALSTALFVMGPRDGERFAREHGLDALLFPADGPSVRVGTWERAPPPPTPSR